MHVNLEKKISSASSQSHRTNVVCRYQVSVSSFPPAPTSVADDSDSDLEDFNDVIEESCKALQFTEQTLQKNRKDPLDLGIFLDPAEYVSAGIR